MINTSYFNIDETKISLKSDISNHNLENYLISIREDLKNYINHNPLFLSSLKPLNDINVSLPIINLMFKSSKIADVGPMATVAGSISELACDYLINLGSTYSIVDNGGDISLINDKKVICGVYSGNTYLDTSIGFKLKKRKKAIGICSSSSKIGLSLSLGDSDCVTVISDKASFSDALATKIANYVKGNSNEDGVNNGLEIAENYTEYFTGALIIKEDSIGTIGHLPEIVSTKPFDINY